MNKEEKNNAVMLCCICNNKRYGQFITIRDKKYHLCCIEQLKDNWNKLKEWLKKEIELEKDTYCKYGSKNINIYYASANEVTLEKIQELERSDSNENNENN